MAVLIIIAGVCNLIIVHFLYIKSKIDDRSLYRLPYWIKYAAILVIIVLLLIPGLSNKMENLGFFDSISQFIITFCLLSVCFSREKKEQPEYDKKRVLALTTTFLSFPLVYSLFQFFEREDIKDIEGIHIFWAFILLYIATFYAIKRSYTFKIWPCRK